jgi:hypothetical protein
VCEFYRYPFAELCLAIMACVKRKAETNEFTIKRRSTEVRLDTIPLELLFAIMSYTDFDTFVAMHRVCKQFSTCLLPYAERMMYIWKTQDITNYKWCTYRFIISDIRNQRIERSISTLTGFEHIRHLELDFHAIHDITDTLCLFSTAVRNTHITLLKIINLKTIMPVKLDMQLKSLVLEKCNICVFDSIHTVEHLTIIDSTITIYATRFECTEFIMVNVIVNLPIILVSYFDCPYLACLYIDNVLLTCMAGHSEFATDNKYGFMCGLLSYVQVCIVKNWNQDNSVSFSDGIVHHFNHSDSQFHLKYLETDFTLIKDANEITLSIVSVVHDKHPAGEVCIWIKESDAYPETLEYTKFYYTKFGNVFRFVKDSKFIAHVKAVQVNSETHRSVVLYEHELLTIKQHVAINYIKDGVARFYKNNKQYVTMYN